LSDSFSITKFTGQKYRGQLILTNPQIINVGQTAYTLAKVYQEANSEGELDDFFLGKEVLLKIIVMHDDEPNIQFIETVSDATNKQTTVEEACKLIEVGYEYVIEFQDQGVKIFRKRK